MMKPKAQTPHDTSLLDYLEDIIGTNSYVQPIEEAAKQYVSASANMRSCKPAEMAPCRLQIANFSPILP